MKTSPFCLGLVLASSAALAAQQPAKSAPAPAQAPSGSLVFIGPGRPCPVAAMRATQGSSLQILRAGNGQSQPLMTPTLTLTPREHRALASAVVTAHGLPPTPGARFLVAQFPSDNGTKANRGITKTLTVKLAPSENGSYSVVLQLPGFSTVTSIALNSVTYTDGATWDGGQSAGCSVAPDPLLLIGGR